MAAMVTPRLYHSTALLLPDARVVTCGGGRTGPEHFDAEIFSPPYLFKGARPTITSAPTTIEYSTDFTVVTPDAASIAKVSLIRLGSVTHAYNSNQRFVPLTFTASGGSLTVQAPTSRNIAPPGHYMLFIVNGAGVPSVAPIVRFPAPAEDVQPPTAPSGLAASSSLGTIALTWTAATDNVGVAAYEIHRSLTAGFTPSGATQIGLSGTTSYTDTGIGAAVTYYYRVIARDARGNTGPPSNQASAVGQPDTTPPGKPTGLVGLPISYLRIDLHWDPGSDDVGVTGYRVRRGGAVIGTTTANDYSSTGLLPATTYTYSIEAYDAAGNTSPLSDSVFVTTPNAPSTAVGRMAAYAFDEGSGSTTADFSGNDHPGTLSNGPTWVAGKYGQGLSFNASDDGNDANDPRLVLGPNVSIPNLPITLSAWVNPASYADWRAILSKRDGSAVANRRLDMGLSVGTGAVYVSTGSTFRSFTYGPPLGVWTHLAVVANPSGTSLYVNGVLSQTVAAISLGSATGANTVVGGTGEGPTGDNDPFKGVIDDVRINDRALTPSEIQSDMSMSVSGSVTAVESVPPAPAAVLRVFPNPFRAGTRIEAPATERIAVFSVDGRLVKWWKAPVDPLEAGVRHLEWDGRDNRGERLPAGVYFVKAGNHIARVTLLR
jgi:hypothetical protein